MEQNLLRRGQQVVLEIAEEDQLRRNSFVVERVSREQVLLVPLTEGDIIRFYQPNRVVKGYIPTPLRAYQFESTVVAIQESPEPLLVLSLPAQVQPVQRRRFFRVRVFLTVQLQSLQEGQETGEGEVYEVFGTDVNAGGIGVRVELRRVPSATGWRVHQQFLLKFHLPTVEREFPQGLPVETVGEIVWIAPADRCLRLGIAFTKIDRNLQERIVSWCFAYQRRLVQMGFEPREG